MNRVRAILRRYPYTTALLAICAAVGAWTDLTGHVYYGPESWWRLAIAAAAGGAAATLVRWEGSRRR